MRVIGQRVSISQCALAQVNDSRGVFGTSPGRIRRVRCLVAHAPKKNARVIAVAPNHFDNVLSLDVFVKVLILDIRYLLDSNQPQQVG